MGEDMLVIPAIDLKDGRCVRLRQGRAEDATTYSDDPVAMAKRWVDDGAKYLHIVDLDGAFQGHPVHQEVIGRIAKAAGVPIEVGGGLRTDQDIQQMLALGVDRAVVGTRAWAEPDLLRQLVDRFGDQLAVGIDARAGRVQVRGWTETTEASAMALANRVGSAGVKYLIYTDTSKDGMMAGVNAHSVDLICRVAGCSVIASGGVSSAADMKKLRGLKRTNLIGAIVGKALYEGAVRLKDLEE
jgi:phosphoribosylformimino-5-aminoimidazole carboxamide ribotide isomerase